MATELLLIIAVTGLVAPLVVLAWRVFRATRDCEITLKYESGESFSVRLQGEDVVDQLRQAESVLAIRAGASRSVAQRQVLGSSASGAEPWAGATPSNPPLARTPVLESADLDPERARSLNKRVAGARRAHR
jgi:hypothetical protein